VRSALDSTTGLDEDVSTFLAICRAAGRSPATLKQYRFVLAKLSTDVPHPVAEMTRADAVAYVEALRLGRKPGGAEAHLRVIRAFFNHLIREEILTKSPFKGLSIKVPEQVMPTATEADIEAMLSRAEDHRDKALVLLLCDTGCRKGEAAGMKFGDVNLQAGTVTFTVSKTRARTVPMSDRLVAQMARYMRKRGTRPGSFWGDEHEPYHYIRHAFERMGEGRITPHQLRRYFAVRWLLAGGSESSLMRLAGWSTSEMVRVYTRAAADQISETEYRRLIA